MNPNNATATKQPIGVSSANPYDTTTGQRLVTPVDGSTPQVQTTPINAGIIGNTKPLTIPNTTPTTAQNTLSATVNAQTQPENTQITQPTTDTTTTNSRQPILDQIKNLIGLENNKGTETTRLQDNQDIAGKTQAVNDINNQILTTSRGYDEQIKNLEKNGTGYNGGNQVAIADLTRQKNEDLANLSIIKSTKLGDLDTANTIVDQKLKAEFEPIEANIKNYTDLYNLTANDLTDSEKLQIQTNIDQQKQTAQNLYNAKQDAYKTALAGGAPASVLAAIGSASTPEAAQQAVGKYGVSAQDKAQIANIYSQMNARNLSNASHPNANPTYTIQSGEDPATIATQNGTDIATLQSLNPQITDWHTIQPGTKLTLPSQQQFTGSALEGSRYALQATRIAKNFLALPIYEATANGQVYLKRIASAAQNPGTVGDAELLDSIVKLNTSGNAITNEQVQLITGYRSFSDSLNVLKNKVQNGGALSDNQRQELNTIAQQTFQSYKAGYQPVYDKVTSKLKQANIPQAFWTIPDLNKLSAASDATSSTPAKSGTLSSGITYTVNP